MIIASDYCAKRYSHFFSVYEPQVFFSIKDFFQLLYFDIIANLQISGKNSHTNSQVPFTWIPSVLTLYYFCSILSSIFSQIKKILVTTIQLSQKLNTDLPLVSNPQT